MTPTIFREGPYRFFFFSREEPRAHVHVLSSEGEAKIWIEPQVELATSYNLSGREIRRITTIVEDRREEIEDAWNRHFGG